MDKLIGRHKEQLILKNCLESGRSEFVVIYGRRRIGKTFLVRRFFNDTYDFSFVGKHEMPREQQLADFAKTLQRYSSSEFTPELKNWTQAFDGLAKLLEAKDTSRKKVIFFDEMPWMDTPKSDFVSSLENFWNGWAAMRDDIVFVANWSRYQIAQCYMILGGVPFYLTLLNPHMSLLSNIDELFFADSHAMLRTEHNELYATLFKRPDNYLTVIRLLVQRKEGYTRKEISEQTGLGGAALTKILSDLEQCDFVLPYARYGNKRNNTIYRIKDFYTLFFYKYIQGVDTKDPHRWTHLSSSQQVASWQGFSFDLLCLMHLDEIKQALGIDRILNDSSAWRSRQDGHGTQIDLVIERADRNINICEMKFSGTPYIINADYERRLRERIAIFRAETATRCSTRMTMVTTYGVLSGKHSAIVDDEVILDDLFAVTDETK